MEWLNIHATKLRAPEYIGCDPVARATWLNLLAYCCEQENGGTIKGGANWKDRQWQQSCGVTLEEIRSSAPLVVINGNDVSVWSYPVNSQNIVQAKREVAITNGRLGGRPKKNPGETQGKPRNNPEITNVGFEKKPTENQRRNPEITQPKPRDNQQETNVEKRNGNGKGKGNDNDKEKKREGEGKETREALPPLASEDLFGADEPPPPRTIDPPDQRTFADLRIMHPAIFIGKDEREDWQRTFATYGWDCMDGMARRLAKQGKERIFLSDAQAWLARNTEDVTA